MTRAKLKDAPTPMQQIEITDPFHHRIIGFVVGLQQSLSALKEQLDKAPMPGLGFAVAKLESFEASARIEMIERSTRLAAGNGVDLSRFVVYTARSSLNHLDIEPIADEEP